MKKSAGIAVGVIVAVGALSTAGAWYTGNQLDGVLRTSIDEANQQMKTALVGFDGNVTLELVSLEKNLFTSTAHYRLKADSAAFGDEYKNVELLFVDHIEHGPLPLSRLKAGKLAPVMATSNYALEQNAFTEKWFAASKGQSPLKGQMSLGYDRATSGTVELLPLDVALDETSNLTFSGLVLNVDASADAEKLRIDGNMDSLVLAVSAADKEPVLMELRGLSLDSDRSKGASGFYLGRNDVKLASVEVKVGERLPLLLKDFSQTDTLEETGSNLAARVTYDIGMISYNGKDIGAAQMIWGLKNLDIAATQSLVKLYESKLQTLQAASDEEAAALPALSDAEKAQLQVDVNQLLAAKPQLALEKLSFKTASGESHFALAVGFNKPESLELPPPVLAQQLIGELSAKLVVSKPMISDVVSVQAALDGQVDQEVIAQQASMMTEMASGMALSTQLAKLEGNDIVSSLHYANNQVDFNGQKMTVEEFVGMVMAMAGGMGGGAADDSGAEPELDLEGLSEDGAELQ